MSKILQAGESGFGILIEHDAGFINSDLNPNKVYETNSESTNIINPTPTSGKYCKYCGSSNQLESKFCQSCGARLE